MTKDKKVLNSLIIALEVFVKDLDTDYENILRGGKHLLTYPQFCRAVQKDLAKILKDAKSDLTNLEGD